MDTLLEKFTPDQISNMINIDLGSIIFLSIAFMVLWLISKFYSAYRAQKLYKTILETKKDITEIKDHLGLTNHKIPENTYRSTDLDSQEKQA